MASVLVDLDDLSYIDDVDEEIEANTNQSNTNESTCSSKEKNKENKYKHKHKKLKISKNNPIGEILTINTDTELIKELRKDRQENKPLEKGFSNNSDISTEKAHDTNKLLTDQKDKVPVNKKQLLQELREERRKSQIELEKKRSSVISSGEQFSENKMENKQNTDNHINVVTVVLHEAGRLQEDTNKSPTNEATDKAKDLDKNLTYKPVRKTDITPTTTAAVADGAEHYAKDTQTTSEVSITAQIGSREYDGDIDEDLSAYSDNVFVEDSEVESSTWDESQTETDIKRFKAIMKSSKKGAAQQEKLDKYDGSQNSLTTNVGRPKDIDLSGGERKDSKPRKKRIRIVVTNEEGIDEHIEDISQSKKDRRKSAVSPDTESSSSISLNYLKKISPERKTSVVEELAKKKKIKPFHNLQKLKRGCYEVGIAGDTKRCNIKAITLMKDKRMVMFDRNNKCLKLFDKDFIPLDRLSVPVKFCGIAAVFEDTVAITFPENKKIQLYHIDKNKFEKGRSHPVEAEFYSIAHHKSKVYLLKRVRKSGLTEQDDWQIVSLDFNQNSDNINTLRTFCPGHQDNTLMVNSGGLYMTHKLENEVLHLGLDGSFKLRYKIQMSLPMGICSDKFGNVYICGGSVTSFVEICKPDLNTSRIIFHKTSCDPVAACFDKQESTLFLCDKIQGNIMKIKIEHSGIIQSLMKSFVMGENI